MNKHNNNPRQHSHLRTCPPTFSHARTHTSELNATNGRIQKSNLVPVATPGVVTHGQWEHQVSFSLVVLNLQECVCMREANQRASKGRRKWNSKTKCCQVREHDHKRKGKSQKVGSRARKRESGIEKERTVTLETRAEPGKQRRECRKKAKKSIRERDRIKM